MRYYMLPGKCSIYHRSNEETEVIDEHGNTVFELSEEVSDAVVMEVLGILNRHYSLGFDAGAADRLRTIHEVLRRREEEGIGMKNRGEENNVDC